MSASQRAWYSSSIREFLTKPADQVLGVLAHHGSFDLTGAQRNAWIEQIRVLSESLAGFEGEVFLEFTIPRMGARVDAIVLLGAVVFVVEFKVGATGFTLADLDQVMDYALDLHHFHEGSHAAWIAPVLVATEAPATSPCVERVPAAAHLIGVSRANAESLRSTIEDILRKFHSNPIDGVAWRASGYKPTPTIIEATLALYRGHSVAEISRCDAGATNLSDTSATVEQVIVEARARSEKAICFVTGVPGAGKTLVGLDVATRHIDRESELYSVFLSGNGPLVSVLQAALARDQVRRRKAEGKRTTKRAASSEVKAFIQNVHHFRDDCLVNPAKPPVEHVAIFDEAQRAWSFEQTRNFMRRKKGIADFEMSEPEFLISCLDRHPDWAVIVCLVGGGQEINTGEAGIAEWARALGDRFRHWRVYSSDRLPEAEYGAEAVLEGLREKTRFETRRKLHLATSIRSFRSERVSQLVKEILDLDVDAARVTRSQVATTYPIFLTRDLDLARDWLRARALGSERYGIVVSSRAERLKPHALDVRTPVDPVKWFLNGKDDVRSSYYLEDVATEFHVQGLELDWTCVVWDADLRHDSRSWKHWSFRGSRWERVKAEERQRYLKNAYRVLLTRARQGMVIVVPRGDSRDPTRLPEFYDPTFEYLRSCEIELLEEI